MTRVESGTACGCTIFIFAAGIRQTAASRSNSCHSAWRSSPGRTKTWGAIFSAICVSGLPEYPSIERSNAPTSLGSRMAA